MKPIFEDTIESVYLDNAATTMMDEEVVEAMLPYLHERYGNPASPHHLGKDAEEGVEAARESVAELLGADTGEIVFTSGGTESNNWALKCGGRTQQDMTQGLGGIAICSAIEHSSVLECVTYSDGGLTVPVDNKGRIDMNELEAIISGRSIRIVSIQHCNNEIGIIHDIPAIAEIVHESGALLHVDAVQSFGKWMWDVDDLGADLVSISSHKIHGPMGVGALYIKAGTRISPLLHGGGQELERRAGTLAVPSIVGFGKACEMAWSKIRTEPDRQRELVRKFKNKMEERHGLTFNSGDEGYAPHIISVNLPGEAQLAAAVLNREYGMCVGTGSACSTKDKKSHVLTAMGMNSTAQEKVLRISLSRFNTKGHVDMLAYGIDRALRELKTRSLV